MNESTNLTTGSTGLRGGSVSAGQFQIPNIRSTERKRPRKTNPRFQTAADEEAEVSRLSRLTVNRDVTQSESDYEIREQRQLTVSNIHIPVLGSYESLDSFVGAPSALIHSSLLPVPSDEETFGLQPNSSCHCYCSDQLPSSWCFKTKEYIFTKGTLILIHKLLRFNETRKFHCIFPLLLNRVHHTRKLDCTKFESSTRLPVVLADGLASAKELVVSGQTSKDVHNISQGLAGYLAQQDNLHSGPVFYRGILDDVFETQTVESTVSIESEPESTQFLQSNTIGVEHSAHIIQIAHRQQSTDLALMTFYGQSSEAEVNPNYASSSANNIQEGRQKRNWKRQPVSTPSQKLRERKANVMKFRGSEVINGVEKRVVSKPQKTKDYQLSLGFDRRNRPRFRPGITAKCMTCGISSRNLRACDRCKTEHPQNSKFYPDPIPNIPGTTINRRQVNAPPKEDVVVDLLSDEDDSCNQSGILRANLVIPVKGPVVQLQVQQHPLTGTTPQTQSFVLQKATVTSVPELVHDESPYIPRLPITTFCARPQMRFNMAPGVLSVSATIPTVRNGTINPSQDSEQEAPEKKMSPQDTIRQMQTLVNNGALASSQPQFTVVTCRSLRIGSYKVDISDTLRITISEIGFLFQVSHCVHPTTISCVIPASEIKHIQAHLQKKLPVIFLTISLVHAAWIRQQLGMSEESGKPNYLCPESHNTCPSERAVVIVCNELSQMDMALIKRMFPRCFSELDFSKANQMLMDAIHYPQEKRAGSKAPSKVSTHVRSTATPPRTIATTKQLEAEADSENHKLVSLKSDTEGRTIWLYKSDLLCLTDEQFLNDQMIDFWLEYVQSNMTENDRSRTHIFSTYFYNVLTHVSKTRLTCKPWENDSRLSPAEKRHYRVRKWTKKVDIFSKDFVIVPINENAHWYLAIICYPGIEGMYNIEDGTRITDLENELPKPTKFTMEIEPDGKDAIDRRDEEQGNPEEEIQSDDDEDGDSEQEKETQVPKSEKISQANGRRIKKRRIKQPCILIFDSMLANRSASRARVISTLREYVNVEYKVRKGNNNRYFTPHDMPGYSPRVPDQQNSYDCGIYVLQYVESFFSHPVQSFLLPIRPALRNWFPHLVVDTKRKTIYEKTCNLIRTAHPENASHIPQLKFKPPGLLSTLLPPPVLPPPLISSIPVKLPQADITPNFGEKKLVTSTAATFVQSVEAVRIPIERGVQIEEPMDTEIGHAPFQRESVLNNEPESMDMDVDIPQEEEK